MDDPELDSRLEAQLIADLIRTIQEAKVITLERLAVQFKLKTEVFYFYFINFIIRVFNCVLIIDFVILVIINLHKLFDLIKILFRNLFYFYSLKFVFFLHIVCYVVNCFSLLIFESVNAHFMLNKFIHLEKVNLNFLDYMLLEVY